MSGYRPVGTELLYASHQAGTVSVPTTTPGSSMTLGLPPVPVPAQDMSNTGSWSSSLRLVMRGILIATATVPTFQFSLYRTTAQPAAFATTTLVGQTAVLAAPTATTGSWCRLEFEIGLRTLALGAASTVTCLGRVDCSALASPFYADIPPGAATYTVSDTSWPADQQVYLWPTLSLGAATAGNTFTCHQMKLYGES
ncbi:MAG TPA: hypothetical protein VGI66_01030 [Streptosporangiaceae bacterium]|jgi:hypothetical protein